MAHDDKRGFWSSLFGNRKQKEHKEADELKSRQRLEERICQVLAERVEVREHEEEPVAVLAREEDAEVEVVELLPISASVLSRRKVSVSASFADSSFEAIQSYAANGR